MQGKRSRCFQHFGNIKVVLNIFNRTPLEPLCQSGTELPNQKVSSYFISNGVLRRDFVNIAISVDQPSIFLEILRPQAPKLKEKITGFSFFRVQKRSIMVYSQRNIGLGDREPLCFSFGFEILTKSFNMPRFLFPHL